MSSQDVIMAILSNKCYIVANRHNSFMPSSAYGICKDDNNTIYIWNVFSVIKEGQAVLEFSRVVQVVKYYDLTSLQQQDINTIFSDDTLNGDTVKLNNPSVLEYRNDNTSIMVDKIDANFNCWIRCRD